MSEYTVHIIVDPKDEEGLSPEDALSNRTSAILSKLKEACEDKKLVRVTSADFHLGYMEIIVRTKKEFGFVRTW